MKHVAPQIYTSYFFRRTEIGTSEVWNYEGGVGHMATISHHDINKKLGRLSETGAH